MAHFLTSVLRSPGSWGLQVERDGSWLVERLELASDSTTRKRGLLGRQRLDEGCGFVIAPTEAVHTFGMQFAIDIVGIARDGRVVKCKHAVPPRRVVLAWRAFAILELPAGTVARLQLVPGDHLTAIRSVA